MRRFTEWLIHRWSRKLNPDLAECYRAVFSSLHGRRLLQHWLDQVYCTVYEGQNVHELWMHNARRAFVQEILENIDMAEFPDKYRVKEESWTPGTAPSPIP